MTLEAQAKCPLQRPNGSLNLCLVLGDEAFREVLFGVKIQKRLVDEIRLHRELASEHEPVVGSPVRSSIAKPIDRTQDPQKISSHAFFHLLRRPGINVSGQIATLDVGLFGFVIPYSVAHVERDDEQHAHGHEGHAARSRNGRLGLPAHAALHGDH